jgi:hypothetical protein
VDLSEYEKHRDELQREFPGWHVWFVPRTNPQGVTWYAQPWPLLNADTAEELAEDIREAHAAIPEGVPSLASWRSYRARLRQLRGFEEAAAAEWERRKADQAEWTAGAMADPVERFHQRDGYPAEPGTSTAAPGPGAAADGAPGPA